MRKIPFKTRMEVLKLYFEGLPYDEIGGRVGVSKGSVVNIVTELMKGRYPEFESALDVVDELRELAVKVKKGGVDIPQATLGSKFYESLQNLGVEPQTLSNYIKLCKKISPPNFPMDKFVNAAVRLCRLEEMLGKSCEEALKDLEMLLKEGSSRLDEINSQVKAMEGRKAYLESELEKLEAGLASSRANLAELIKGAESLERLGVDKVCKLSNFGREFEELGYSVKGLLELIKLVDQKASLQKRIATLKEEIPRAEREKLALISENRALSVVRGILKSRTTTMACSYCGKTIMVPLPNVWQLGDAMNRWLAYPTRCHYCGYTNQVSPRDILASIGWSILAMHS